jgi:uncharacterized protein YjbI with pentapeptide repeats
MIGSRLRVIGTGFALAIALVTPVLAITAATPTSADIVVNGCTIVSVPTPTHFTDCPGANLSNFSAAGLNLSYADLAGALFATCTTALPAPGCLSTDLTGANLTQANLTGATFFAAGEVVLGTAHEFVTGAATLTSADLSGASLAQAEVGPVPLSNAVLRDADLTDTNFGGATLTDADLSDTNLTGTLFESAVPVIGTIVDATLTGANLSGTTLVPPNQSVPATSPAGAVVTWSTPPAIPDATPGSCVPASGSTFPLFTSTVTCQIIDANGDVATGAFEVTVQPTTQYFSRMLIPSNGSSLNGQALFDAEANDVPGVTKVQYVLTGGALNQAVIATGTPTLYGWLAFGNTTAVPNGSYVVQSVATDVAHNVSTSTDIAITVDNPAPSTSIGLPANNATITGGQWLDASASPGVAKVVYELTGGAFSDTIIATAAPTIVGWLADVDSTKLPNGLYTLRSVASYAGGVSGMSAPVSITVSN